MTNRTLQSSVKEKKIEREYRRRDRKMDFQIAKGILKTAVERKRYTGDKIERQYKISNRIALFTRLKQQRRPYSAHGKDN